LLRLKPAHTQAGGDSHGKHEAEASREAERQEGVAGREEEADDRQPARKHAA
jgi:hypothetical protein